MNSFFSGKFVWVLGLALALTASCCSCSGGEQQPVAENTAAVVQPSEAPSKKFTLGVNPSAKPVVLDEKPLAGTYQVMDPKLKLPVAIFETPAGWVGSSQVRWLNSYPNVAVWKVNFSHPRTEVAGSYTSNIMICGEPTTVAKMELMKNPQSLVDICLDDVKSLANFKGKIKVEDAKIIPNDGLRISKLAEEIDKTMPKGTKVYQRQFVANYSFVKDEVEWVGNTTADILFYETITDKTDETPEFTVSGKLISNTITYVGPKNEDLRDEIDILDGIFDTGMVYNEWTGKYNSAVGELLKKIDQQKNAQSTLGLITDLRVVKPGQTLGEDQGVYTPEASIEYDREKYARIF